MRIECEIWGVNGISKCQSMGAREQRHRQHCTAQPQGARQGHGAQQQPRASQGEFSRLQGLQPKAAPKRNAGSISEHHTEGEKYQESG